MYAHTLVKSQQVTEEQSYVSLQRPDATLHVSRSLGMRSQQVEFNPGMTYLVIDMGGINLFCTRLLYRRQRGYQNKKKSQPILSTKSKRKPLRTEPIEMI